MQKLEGASGSGGEKPSKKHKHSKPSSSSSLEAKVGKEPQQQLQQQQQLQDSPLLKMKGDDKFWSTVDPYCADIAQSDIVLLEEGIKSVSYLRGWGTQSHLCWDFPLTPLCELLAPSICWLLGRLHWLLGAVTLSLAGLGMIGSGTTLDGVFSHSHPTRSSGSNYSKFYIVPSNDVKNVRSDICASQAHFPSFSSAFFLQYISGRRSHCWVGGGGCRAGTG